MGDPEDKDDKHADDLARLPSLFKEWSGVVATFGGAVAALLAVLLPQQTSAKVQVIGYAVALTLVGVGVGVFVRVRRRQGARERRERRRAAWEREAPGARLAAFRGLLPYQEGDELPGEHRRLEARRLVTQFSEPTFSFGVVCGDSGCGKTSLLRSAIQRSLKAVGEERGFGVHYLSSPRELWSDGAAAGGRDAASRLRGELERLRQVTEGAARGSPLILILDQFEEFFIEYDSPELRLELGRFLDGLIKSSPPVRVLCAIRRDYLADMKDLAPADPEAAKNFFEPLSLQGLFTLKNFTVEQAARVIRECAERDRIVLDEEFAERLASDLGDGDTVRPPELQIVCRALGSDPTLAGYRLAGGARGILAHHVGDAIEVSDDPDTGRRVLRALCDFPAHAKRNPQTAAEIAEAAGAQGPQAQAFVRAALKRFQGARLVVSERRGGEKTEKRGAEEPAYALVHDYLVDAVSQATRDVTTRDEEANQMLAYYVSEYRDDPKTRVPFRRLRFIRRHADAKQLADPTARRLLRANLMRLATSAAALTSLVVVATTLLVALTTTNRGWRQEVVGNHWEGSESGNVGWTIQPKRGLLITGIADGTDASSVKLWDVSTGRLTYSSRRETYTYVPPDYILGYSADEPFMTAVHIPTGREYQTVIPTQLVGVRVIAERREELTGELTISPSGTTVAVRELKSFLLDEGETEPEPSPPVMRVFSVRDNKELVKVPTCDASANGDARITDDGEYFLAPCYAEDYLELTAFNLRTKEQKVLTRSGFETMSWAFDEKSRAASLELADDRRAYLVLWDIRTGRVLNQRQVPHGPDDVGDVTSSIEFTAGGEFIVVQTDGSDAPGVRHVLTLYRAGGLGRMEVPEEDVGVIGAKDQADDAGRKKHLILAWPNEPGGTYLWDLTEAEPKLIADLTLPADLNDVPSVSLVPAGVRALNVVKEKKLVELWDFKVGKKLRDLDIPGRFNEVGFTIGANAVSVNVEGGTVSLFRADNGEKITDEIHNIGGTWQAFFFDEKCHRAHVWTDEGRVLRYTEGWRLFGRENWFWPAERCEAQ